MDSNKLILGDRLGSGSFGEVYDGLYFGKPVAIKIVLKEKIINSKEIESELCSLQEDLYHRNIVPLLNFDLSYKENR